MSEVTRINLTDAERLRVVGHGRHALVGIVDFRGPRGRRYRSTRTGIHFTAERVQEEIDRIRGGRYAHGAYAYASTVRVVNHLGQLSEVKS